MRQLLSWAMELMIEPMSSTAFSPGIRRSDSFPRAREPLWSTATIASDPAGLTIRSINEHGRMNWQKTSGYNRCSRSLTACWNSGVLSAYASPNIRFTGNPHSRASQQRRRRHRRAEHVRHGGISSRGNRRPKKHLTKMIPSSKRQSTHNIHLRSPFLLA